MQQAEPGLGKCVRALVCGVLLSALPGVAAAAPAGDDKVSLNFVNADIESTVRAISMISGRNFLLDPRVKGTINVISSSPIAPELAYPILVSALRLQGFAVVEGNGVTKVVPEAEAKTHALPTMARSKGGDNRLVTRVIPLRNESASQMLPILRPLVTPNNAISVYPANNTLVITDYADNVKRLEKLIEAIEQNASENPAVFRLKHVAATDMAGLLNRLFVEGPAAAGTEAGQRPSIIADSRSNSIIVRSENPVAFVRIRTLLAELDQAPAASGNIHVVSLKNAEATKLAQTLRAILSGESAVLPAPTLAAAAGTSGSSGATGAAGTAGAFSAGAAGSAAPPGLANGSSIQADAATNSLIIVAPDPVFRNLQSVIEVLDRRRAQVFIEALIVEISADRATELGFQWQSYEQAGNNATRVVGGTNFGAPGTGRNIIEVARSPGAIGTGLAVGVVKGTVTVPGLGTINNLALLARFLESDANANILSTPNLVTLDNEEGKIVIGQNLPFLTGQYALSGAATSPTPFQTIERKDVGLSLKVKPQISEGGTVRVLIAQEVSSVAAGSANSTLGPVTNKRSIDSTVLVDDGGIIALGGLMEDSYGAGEDKVPLLGDIPVIGNLFRYGTRKRTKTNLMVFLRPQVIRDEAANQRLAAEHYRRIRDEQAGAMPDRQMSGEAVPPQLPALRLAPELRVPPVTVTTPVPEKQSQ